MRAIRDGMVAVAAMTVTEVQIDEIVAKAHRSIEGTRAALGRGRGRRATGGAGGESAG